MCLPPYLVSIEGWEPSSTSRLLDCFEDSDFLATFEHQQHILLFCRHGPSYTPANHAHALGFAGLLASLCIV